MSAQVYSVPGQSEGRKGGSSWNGKAKTYPINHLLHVGVMLTIIKVFIILFLLCLWE